MHIFIDTNIFLNFFHFTKDDLDALNDVFASQEHDAATVYLTEQVRDEIRRARGDSNLWPLPSEDLIAPIRNMR
ncbi:hypothetical protein BXY39_1673 [Eilatimonas milleporae]|uniref:Uncharacterized protein n=1 Tax=Eilatimonas milleporae TaxID=911205 RepID=A0A3M0CQC8_9PROT|nr:hypothetical protein BXY39_1673 [Eilatimonas milleporae]